MSSVFYDFKRNFLRIPVLVITLAFVLLGVGMAYNAYSTVVLPHTYLYHDVNVVGMSEGSEVIGYVFNNQGSGISHAKVIVGGGGNTYYTNSSGYFVITTNCTKPILVCYDHQEVSFTVTPLFENVTCFISASGFIRSVPLAFILVKDNLIMLTSNPAGQNVSITFVNVTTTNVTYVERLNGFFNVYKINSPVGSGSLVVSSSGKSVTTTYAYCGSGYISLTLNGLDPAFVFASLAYPLVMIYLAYVMFARPRDTGALKFLLSRPISRTGLFLSRYLGGIAIALVASFLVSALTYFTYTALLSSSNISMPTNVFFYFLDYAIAVLVIMFSLVMMFSTFIKSSTAVLGLSIGVFLFFQIGFGEVFPLSGIIPSFIYSAVHNFFDAVKITAELYYFNPFGIGYYTIYYTGKQFHAVCMVPTIHLPLVVLSVLLWIIVPAVIGLIRFRKIDL